MSNRLILAIIAVVVALSAMSARSDSGGGQPPSKPLEVRITRPLSWRNNCLQVNIDRVNRSSTALFLPVQGLSIGSSTTLVTETGESSRVRWVAVWGVSDIINSGAESLAPGATKHDDICLPPSTAVVNLKEKTSRQLPLRGKLMISATYFLTEQDWLRNKSQVDAMFKTAPNTWPKVKPPKVTTITAPIPCRETACLPACEEPPLLREGEVKVIPDTVSDEPSWIERGRVVSTELEKKQAPCDIR